MKIGYDISEKKQGYILASRNHWYIGTYAVFQLYLLGTIPNKHSLKPDMCSEIMMSAEAQMKIACEQVIELGGWRDSNYCEAILNDSISAINEKICKVNELLGQGNYLGGSIVIATRDFQTVCCFGGSCCYVASNDRLTRVAGFGEERFPTDAIGSRPKWNGHFQHFHLNLGEHLICSSYALNEERATTELQKLQSTYSRNAYPENLLVRLLCQNALTAFPKGVIEIEM